MRQCSKCGETRPLDAFTRDKRRSDGYGSWCRPCHAKSSRTRSKSANHQPPAIGERQCGSCGETKPLTEFPRRKDSPCGFRSTCKSCWNEASLRWAEANPEKARRRWNAWRDQHLDEQRKRENKYDTANRENRRLARATARAERPEHDREIRLSWRRANPHKVRDYYYRYYETVRDATPDTTEYIGVLLGDPCSYCGEPMDHIDHIVPRARGGSHHWMNLTAACASCNPAKSSKPLLLWLADR